MVQPSNSVSANSSDKSNNSRIDIPNIISLVLDIALLVFKFWVAIIQSIFKTFVPQEIDVKGQTVLITGTGHGIGKELALQYSALGAKLICWDMNEEANQQTVKDIKAYGGEAYAYTCDVTKRDAINVLAEKVKKEHGFFNIVVNNAGIMPCHPMLEHTETEIRTMYEINVLAHFWIIQAFLPDMLVRNEGHFVALSSCAGLFGVPNLVPYCGTKFAVRGLMQCSRRLVRVGLILPMKNSFYGTLLILIYFQALSEELLLKNPQNNIKFTTIYP